MKRPLLALLFSVFLTIPALADYDMTGTWSSTSGSTIVVPNSDKDFILVVTHKDGKVFKLKAKWVAGLVGTQFTFINEYGRKVTSTIDSQDVNKVKLTVEDRVYYWQRVAQ